MGSVEPLTESKSVLYNDAFFSHRRNSTIESAKIILGIVKKHYDFKSVVDIGCGTGTWLSIAKSMGATVEGFEGPWLQESAVDDQSIPIHRVNLEIRLPLIHADLAICLEVAEHLSCARADSLVAELCEMAPCVLFSAAIPKQGGVGHLNEEWQSVWADRFAKHGYRPRDIVRPEVWSIDTMPYWYRQNLLLYVNPHWAERIAAPPNSLPLDIAHPVLFADLANSKPGLKDRVRLALGIPALFVQKVISRLK